LEVLGARVATDAELEMLSGLWIAEWNAEADARAAARRRSRPKPRRRARRPDDTAPDDPRRFTK
jgi:hypothetical protein